MLRLGRHEFDPHEPVIMAIVNRTPDSFYDQGSTYEQGAAIAAADSAVRAGAEILELRQSCSAAAREFVASMRKRASYIVRIAVCTESRIDSPSSNIYAFYKPLRVGSKCRISSARFSFLPCRSCFG